LLEYRRFDYRRGHNHRPRNLRYQGEAEKTPVLMDREDIRTRTSIE
jgi:hypothetical protein